MKKSHLTGQQIAYALQHQELGTSVDEICRKLGIAQVKLKQQLNRLRGFFSDDALAAGHHPSTQVLEVGQGVWPKSIVCCSLGTRQPER